MSTSRGPMPDVPAGGVSDARWVGTRAYAALRDERLLRHARVDVPLLCGAMYPCSNPELVAAVSAAGALGVFQPVSLTYVHGHEFREGIRLMQRLAGHRPLGMNALIESSSRAYHERMVRWVNVALEEGVRFFVTSLGNPAWVVRLAMQVGGMVYHDVTEARWARKGVDAGVNGLIAVNRRAGGHSGTRDAAELLEEVAPFGLPAVCAGGIGDAAGFLAAIRLGYAGAQVGTRFIATPECTASARYKQAILDASAADIVHTERLTGVPVAVIRNAFVERMGTSIGPLARRLFRHRRTKRLMRSYYALRSIAALKRSNSRGSVERDYWQAGMSVDAVERIEPAGEIVAAFRDALAAARRDDPA